MDATAIPGASCPAHLAQPISGTCVRCGGFLCSVCMAEAGGARCAGCVQRERSGALASLDIAGAMLTVLDLRLRTLNGTPVP